MKRSTGRNNKPGTLIGVEAGTTPVELNNPQRVLFYHDYLEDTFRADVTDTLERMPSDEAAHAFADVLFRVGAPAGAPMIRRAINAVEPSLLAEHTWINEDTIAAYVRLAADPATRGLLSDALIAERNRARPNEKARNEHFAF